MRYKGQNRLFLALRDYADYLEVMGSMGFKPAVHQVELSDRVAAAMSRKFRGGLFIAMNRFYGRNVGYRKGWVL